MNKIKNKLILVLISIFLITGCNKKYESDIKIEGLCNCNKIENCECKNLYQTVNYDQAKQLIYDGNTLLVDVRSIYEYNAKHINGAISAPLEEIENMDFAKNINLIVYCRSGSRSREAALKLLELGYVNVYDLGSIDNWQE